MNVELLLPPQREHAVNLLNSLYINGVACDQSETGTGKSYVAAWIAKNLNSPVVIVCPKIMIPAWTKVLSYFGIKAHCLINYEKLIRGNTLFTISLAIVSLSLIVVLMLDDMVDFRLIYRVKRL